MHLALSLLEYLVVESHVRVDLVQEVGVKLELKLIIFVFLLLIGLLAGKLLLLKLLLLLGGRLDYVA